jgi:2-oxoglutarate ferredoxin oxidoreductase subunit alpha
MSNTTRYIDKQTFLFLSVKDTYASPIDIAKYSATQATFVEIPMTKIARETTGHFLAQNVVALGASTYLFGLQHELLATIIREQFEKKGEEVINANLKALEAGFAYAKEHCKPKVTTPVAPQPRPQVLMTGNQVVGTAALAAGVQYCSMYPMTPTSEILHFLAAQQHRFPLLQTPSWRVRPYTRHRWLG